MENMLLCGLRMRDLLRREDTKPVSKTAKQVFDEMTQVDAMF